MRKVRSTLQSWILCALSYRLKRASHPPLRVTLLPVPKTVVFATGLPAVVEMQQVRELLVSGSATYQA